MISPIFLFCATFDVIVIVFFEESLPEAAGLTRFQLGEVGGQWGQVLGHQHKYQHNHRNSTARCWDNLYL